MSKTKTKKNNILKKKHKNNKKSIKQMIGGSQRPSHISTSEEIKYIYIKNDGGFGNKVFDLIFALYLYNKYNDKHKKCKIIYIIKTSKHEKTTDPKLNEIFSNFNDKIKFIILDKYEDTRYNNILSNVLLDEDKLKIHSNLFDTIYEFPSYEKLKLHNEFIDTFQLTYKMYSTFIPEQKKLFIINEDILIEKQILKRIKDEPEYAIVHIRYGDKINLPKEFITYTPQYYIDKIKILQIKNPNMNIYIISDSNSDVKEFIMKPESNFINFKKVILLEHLNWLDSFYLLYYAKFIIMSLSTFCMAGAYFNIHTPPFPECYICIPSYKHIIQPDETAALESEWIIDKNIDYILNSDKNKVIRNQMCDFYNSTHPKTKKMEKKITFSKQSRHASMSINKSPNTPMTTSTTKKISSGTYVPPHLRK